MLQIMPANNIFPWSFFKRGIFAAGVLILWVFLEVPAIGYYYYTTTTSSSTTTTTSSITTTTTSTATTSSVTTTISPYDHYGDINSDGAIDLTDAILSMQILNQVHPADPINPDSDIDGNGRTGLEEALYILQHISGLRQSVGR